jgi:hypothetical protein
LPLAIANSYGWDVLSPYTFTATWNGGPSAQDVSFEARGNAPYLSHFVNGNFTHGVVTLHTGYLFPLRDDLGENHVPERFVVFERGRRRRRRVCL